MTPARNSILAWAVAAVALEATVGATLGIGTGWPVPPGTLGLGAIESVRWEDVRGEQLSERVGGLENRATWVPLAEIPPAFLDAVIATEDHRFYSHGGIDLVAVVRAARDNIVAGRIVSGGSTLTQQLARLLLTERALAAEEGTPSRSIGQKLREAWFAVRLEASFDKGQLLEAFANHAPFGDGAIGIAAAAERLFGGAVATLSLAQAALLAGLPRGPSYYNPRRHPERADARRRWVIGRMGRTGRITEGMAARALAEPVALAEHEVERRAIHAVALARRELEERLGETPQGTVTLTVDATLHARITAIVQGEIPRLYAKGARSAAVVVIDNASGDVLALVGAAFEDNPQWGQYDAATATRQPGSALKPFLYAAALEGGATAASLAADIERPFPDTWGIYQPENYDRQYHGPVRYREALAQSLNIAAVDVLHRAGLDTAFDLLDRLGLNTLDRRPSYFGLGLALGSGGVRLIDLTNAFATLARGGSHLPWRIVRRAETADGVIEPESGDPTPVIDPRVAFIIADIISDAQARVPQFGERSVLRTPYWTAVKTGTSKGFRDNWTVGFSDRHTVGVWVGDPAGRPMRKVSGVEGAGIIWRRVINEVSGYRSRQPEPVAGLSRARVCGLSGLLLGPECPGGRDEWFVEGTEPTESCDFHRRVRIDPQKDLIVPDGCVLPGAREEVVIVYPSPYDAWAEQNERGRALVFTDRCPEPPAAAATVTLLSPAPTEAVRIDPDTPRPRQSLPLHAVATGPGAQRVTFLIDDVPFSTVERPHRVHWPVTPGLHRVQARLEGSGAVSAVHLVEVY